ncbi:inner membrane transporter RhtA [Jatrophihabitans endophyticus]|uniref:Inner membrane transporter RhtA n=1 Tax=Jatrophihabitans endophyticus TaxID=1206085 RepID=A0A1M5K2N6_9ACTN|nr:EamA family transporter [Jatrophihabitans endophyticus]SHG47011.1 inner membrane transporter RhtA [Jatrophihabitans endophyticus]
MPAARSAPARSARADAAPPQLLLLGAVGSVQFGSAFADKIFGSVGPGGVAFLRVLFTAVVLLVVVRPRLTGRTPAQLRLVAAYGLALAGMNWSFYEALDHLPLGVAVTVEFTGPLAVAVAGSRRLLDGVWVLLAGGGVALLASRGGEDGVEPIGIALVLIAASCWALYILLAKRVGASYGALEALALGMAVGTVLVAPAGVAQGGTALLHPGVLAGCLGVAVLSSLIPYSLELVALRRLSTAVFGLLMSLEPAMAALAGVLVLGEDVSVALAVAVVLVATASVGSSLTSRRPASPLDG